MNWMSEEKIDFGILETPGTERHQTMPDEKDDGFRAWLLTDRAVGERWAKEISYIMGKMLRELSDPSNR